MQLTTRFLVSALILTLSLAFSVDAAATNNKGGDDKYSNSSKSSSSNKNNNGGKNNDRDDDRDDDRDHDWDRDWDRDRNHDWDRNWDRDWGRNWSNSWRKDWDDWKRWGWGHSHGNKVFICHQTGSSRNPYVLIQVSSSAKQAHYNHGDPQHFSDLGNGKCRPAQPPGPPPKPTVSLSLTLNPIYVGTGTTSANWTSTNATSCAFGSGPSLGASGSLTLGPYPTIGPVPVTLTCTGAGGSKAATVQLNVVDPPAPPPLPTISLSLTFNPIYEDTGTSTANWTSTNATNCSPGTGTPTGAPAGSLALGPFASTGDVPVTVTCSGPGGSTTETVQLSVVALPAPPTVFLSLAPNPIYVNTGTTTVSWISSDASSCDLGNGAASGTATLGPYTAVGDVTVSITCTGPGGTATDSKVLSVIPLVPTVSLSLAPSQIYVDTGTTTATWTSTNATSCDLGDNAAAGSTSLGPYSTLGEVTISITCTGPGGTATDSEILDIISAPEEEDPPTVTLTLFPDVINVGGVTIASWTSTDATSCTLGNGAVSGSVTVGPFNVLGTFGISISCTGPGGTVTDLAELEVVEQAATVDVCAISDLGGGTPITWIVTYDYATGEFAGESEDDLEIAGLVTPGIGVSTADALFTSGSSLLLESADVTAESFLPSIGQGAGILALSLFFIDVAVEGEPAGSTTFGFAATCLALETR